MWKTCEEANPDVTRWAEAAQLGSFGLLPMLGIERIQRTASCGTMKSCSCHPLAAQHMHERNLCRRKEPSHTKITQRSGFDHLITCCTMLHEHQHSSFSGRVMLPRLVVPLCTWKWFYASRNIPSVQPAKVWATFPAIEPTVLFFTKCSFTKWLIPRQIAR